MRITRVSSALFALCLSFVPLHSQTTTVSSIDSSYPITVPTGSAVNFSTATIGVSYPIGLTPGSYISGTQLNTDFQSFLTAYPSPTDPPEAILSTVLQAILNKYPQMTGGTLSGEIGGTYMGIPIPGAGGSVTVAIGTYSLGALGLSRRPVAKPKSDPAPSPAPTTTH
jgi:hypothetical protein